MVLVVLSFKASYQNSLKVLLLPLSEFLKDMGMLSHNLGCVLLSSFVSELSVLFHQVLETPATELLALKSLFDQVLLDFFSSRLADLKSALPHSLEGFLHDNMDGFLCLLLDSMLFGMLERYGMYVLLVRLGIPDHFLSMHDNFLGVGVSLVSNVDPAILSNLHFSAVALNDHINLGVLLVLSLGFSAHYERGIKHLSARLGKSVSSRI
jgi:hypothetical protein